MTVGGTEAATMLFRVRVVFLFLPPLTFYVIEQAAMFAGK
jgi:hypothetical protein